MKPPVQSHSHLPKIQLPKIHLQLQTWYLVYQIQQKEVYNSSAITATLPPEHLIHECVSLPI